MFNPDPQQSLWRLLEEGAGFLDRSDICFGHGTDNAWDEALSLLLWASGLNYEIERKDLEARPEKNVVEKYVEALNRRVDERIPAAYITGAAWFCGYEFIVNSNVLVPRSPIAELINNRFSPWVRKEPRRILDLCAGSGCIGIATALEYLNSEIVLSDISSEALEVAKANIKKHDPSNVTTVESDVFKSLGDQSFDLILTNPPYVNAQDLSSMPLEYLQEPEIGLGSGEDGLDLSRIILAEAVNHLNLEGVLILEVGNSWVSLEKTFPRFPFTWIEFEYGGEGVCVLSRSELVELVEMYF